jgi:3-phosphoshikimate 1-carboxyvinyltransferase
LDPLLLEVPADPSAAAFWWVAAALVPGSVVETVGVGLNPTRSGALEVLQQMGARVEVSGRAQELEPVGRVRVEAGPLSGTTVGGDLTLRALDEVPVLAVAAAFARGPTRFTDAAELRVKESDRLARVAQGLRAMGVRVDEEPDGMTVWGGSPRGPATIDCRGDHRLAMAFAVAGLAAPGGVELVSADEVGTSNPRFFQELDRLTGGP